jgi:hypothetical protein
MRWQGAIAKRIAPNASVSNHPDAHPRLHWLIEDYIIALRTTVIPQSRNSWGHRPPMLDL